MTIDLIYNVLFCLQTYPLVLNSIWFALIFYMKSQFISSHKLTMPLDNFVFSNSPSLHILCKFCIKGINSTVNKHVF